MELLIGFGGNTGDVASAFAAALEGLAPVGTVLARSSIWRSSALGPPQEDFINAVALVRTAAGPHAILALCRRLEADAGRVRAARWGPRPLDLDLLIAPGLVVRSADLALPHPRLAERRFALAPAAEVAPDWLHPERRRTLAELAASPEIAAQRCDRLGPWTD